LFSNGHIADPELALSLAGTDAATEPKQPPELQRHPNPGRLRWLFEELVLLGGRPVSREHLDDLDEPFPQLHPSP
jgi:hypothetical protein